jgi:hypothetical protein
MSIKQLFILILFLSCKSDDQLLGECFGSPKGEIACIKIYEPVCACNNLVYSNSCEADKAGNLKWKSTKLSTGESCNY